MYRKHVSQNGFCEWISNHLMRRQIFQDHFLSCNNISYKIILGIYMLSSFMIFWVLYISNHSLTVTIDCCWPKTSLTISKLCKNLFNHIVSCATTEQAINSTSMVNKAIQVCFLLFHEIAPLLSKNVYPDVDLRSSRSPAQLASE